MSPTLPRHRGFTLMEVLAVVLLTTLLLGVALDFYIDLSNQSTRASENTREVRRASAVLDHVAADLEQALLVRKPAETDPLAHPWVFVADSRYSAEGADRVKFVMRQSPRYSDGAAADVAMVAYVLQPDEDGSAYELRRWSSPGLPESLDREFPPDGDPDSLLLVDGIDHFALRFLNESGEWLTRWDSSQLLESSELPLAVEIEVALAHPSGDPGQEEARRIGWPDGEPVAYVRQVQLPLRPLDLETLLDPETYGGGGTQTASNEEEDQSCRTVADCVDLSVLTPDLAPLAAQAQTTCFEPYKSLFIGNPAVNPSCL